MYNDIAERLLAMSASSNTNVTKQEAKELE